MNPLFLNALACKNLERPPVWLMRQAGRALPDYREIRKSHSLEELFRTPELAAHLTCMPVRQLGVDAAILFSDILILADLFGLELRFVEGRGPVIEPAITPATVEKLVSLPASHLGFVYETIRRVRVSLPETPLIGFCGGPFTVASYFVEGGAGGKELSKTKQWLFSHPESFEQLLEKITEASIGYLKTQIQAGAQAVQIFDSWANVLSEPFLTRFCLRYLEKIVTSLKGSVPVILFARGSSFFPTKLAALGPAAISFDWHKELAELRRQVPRAIAVQGNLDPHLLLAPPAVIQEAVRKLLQEMHGEPGFILNLGHGVLPNTPFDNLKCFVETVKNYQRTSGGMEQRIASGLPPERKPNCVPRS